MKTGRQARLRFRRNSCLVKHIAEDHLHTVITKCNIEEPHQKYRLGTFSNRLVLKDGG